MSQTALKTQEYGVLPFKGLTAGLLSIRGCTFLERAQQRSSWTHTQDLPGDVLRVTSYPFSRSLAF